MADANIRINVETSSLEQLNAELSALQAQIAKVPVGSAEFKKLSAEIRRVDGAVEGANRKLKSLDVGAVAGDVAKLGGAVASASALFKQFGSEGSDSQKAIQSALETTNTILGAGAIAEGVASAARLAGVAATKAATIAQSAYTAVVGTSTGALKAFKIALASTGIGLAVIALGKLAEATDIFGSKTENNAEKAEKALKNYQRRLNVVFGSLDDQYRKDVKNATLAGQTEEQLNALKIKLLNERLALIQVEGAKLKFGETEKRAELVKLEVGYSAELDALEIERYKKSEERRKKAIEDEQQAAQKRRDILKAEIDAIVEILSESDRDIKLATLEGEQKTVLQGLDNITKKTKTFAEVLAQLRAEGQGPYADFINNLFQSGKKIEEISKIINDSFAKQKANVIGEFFQDGTEKIKENFDKLVESIDEFKSKYQKFIDDFRTKTSEFLSSLLSETKRPVLFSFTPESLFPPIDDVKKKFEEIQAEAKKFLEDSEKNLRDLKTAGKITEEDLKKSLEVIKKLGEEFNKEIKKGKEETVKNLLDTSSSLIQEVIKEAQATAQDEINKLETELYEDLYFSDKKSKAERIKLEKTFQLEKNLILSNSIQQEIDLLQKQESDIEELAKKGIITEQERADKVIEIQRKVNALKLQAVKLDKEIDDNTIIIELGGLTPEQLAERAQAFLQVLEKIKEAYAFISGSIQAIGNLLADQAALQDLRFEEEIQKVQELYDERFRLIDEEEKKLDALEQAKDNKISATERKRRALAKERAGLEAQQAEELAQLEADRANAAADAAIKQAEVNFALATGQILISTAEAVAKSIAQSPQTFGLPFSAFAIAQGAIQLAAANSARQVAIAQAEASRPGVSGAKNVRVSKAEGGLITGPGNAVSDSIPANLSNGEFVVNANATRQFLPLLNQINQSGLQGGNPVNASGFSDPVAVALLQEIKSELAKPARSYVVYNDIENIQNKQNYINRRSNVL